MNTETWCNTITKIIKCPPLLADISGYYFPTNDKSSLASFLPVLGMQFCPLFPLWKPFLKVGLWESNVLLRRSGQYIWLTPVKASIQTLRILADAEIYSPLWLPETSLLCKSFAYYNCHILSGVVSVFLRSLCPPCMGGNLWNNIKKFFYHSCRLMCGCYKGARPGGFVSW